MTTPILSILIPTVPERIAQLSALVEKLRAQHSGKIVEILYFGDNRCRTIGAKRNALLQAARGKYVAFCDDDDTVSDDYLSTLLDIGQAQDVDVISFRQSAIWNGQKSEVHFSIQNGNEPFNPGGITKRFPWHSCAWNRGIAQSAVFTEKQWGEDFDWLKQVVGQAKREAHIPRVLHHYTHADIDSLAK
jgi:glycosyltransferase involved in cell wall biosynthesis